jgi:hypothetical protein
VPAFVLGDILPDPTLLPSHLRDAVVSRLVVGESCASIGARHGRTEQTVSGWLRSSLAELKRLLDEPVQETADRESMEIAAQRPSTASTP